MTAMIKTIGWFLNLILPNWVAGITLAPFGIYIRKNLQTNFRLINHESIHWEQQGEMLYIFFYLWYLTEWLLKLPKYGKKAYKNLSFEREANTHENDVNYEVTRKPYAWLLYL